ncbi:MAG: hypothetical protein AAGU25_02025 [bacterium]|jgi:exopolyphosphatase/guanosine-5'-triphosphate,3'-diphosphate pyrophosphatase
MDSDVLYSQSQYASLQSVFQLAKTCQFDEPHTRQVVKLALQIFDVTRELHELGDSERYLLLCSSLLHDIGWIDGWKNHHKGSLRIILAAPLLRMSASERLLIGNVARYHRGALPSLRHDHYATLEPAQKELVNKLGAILRLADGLDNSHQQRVKKMAITISRKKMFLTCQVSEPLVEEEAALAEKSALFEQCYKRKIILKQVVSLS